jgi:hypothetical protein
MILLQSRVRLQTNLWATFTFLRHKWTTTITTQEAN